MVGVIYCRVSSKEQIEGTSLESQQAACHEYAASKGIEVLRVFVEQGESAKFADRTQLLELIDFCRVHKGSIHMLLVWKIDRFARNVSDHFSVKATLVKYGVRIVSVTEPIDQNPEGRLMETILAGFAQFDNDIRAMRTVQGMRRKLQEGILPWGPPRGYVSRVANGEKKTVPDGPSEPTFGLLQKAWREFATGAHTQAEMGRLMQSWGVESIHGKPFAPQSLYQLFTNPYYAGILIDPWTGEEYEGRHVPMVTHEEFAQVQQVIAGRNRSRCHEKERAEFPLRGLVRCDSCRGLLTAAFSRGNGGRYPYYLCSHDSCERRGKSHKAESIHQEFTSFLEELAPRAQLVEELGDRIMKAVAKSNGDMSRHAQRRRARIAGLERESKELIRMRAKSLIADDEFVAQKKALRGERLILEKQDRGSLDINRVRNDLKRIAAPLETLRETWNSLAPPLRRRFERIMLPGGFVNGKIRTADLGPLFSVFRANSVSTSSGVPSACVRSNHIISDIHALSDVISGIPCQEEIGVRSGSKRCSRRTLRMRSSNLTRRFPSKN